MMRNTNNFYALRDYFFQWKKKVIVLNNEWKFKIELNFLLKHESRFIHKILYKNFSEMVNYSWKKMLKGSLELNGLGRTREILWQQFFAWKWEIFRKNIYSITPKFTQRKLENLLTHWLPNQDNTHEWGLKKQNLGLTCSICE